MRMKKATAFGLAALMAATMIPAVPAMAKGDDSEGSVYYLNFKPEQADQWSDLAKKYTDFSELTTPMINEIRDGQG